MKLDGRQMKNIGVHYIDMCAPTTCSTTPDGWQTYDTVKRTLWELDGEVYIQYKGVIYKVESRQRNEKNWDYFSRGYVKKLQSNAIVYYSYLYKNRR